MIPRFTLDDANAVPHIACKQPDKKWSDGLKDDKKPSGPKPLTRREVAEIAPDLKAEYAVCVKEYDLPRFKRLLGKYAPDKDRETKDKLIEEFIALAEAYRAARRAR